MISIALAAALLSAPPGPAGRAPPQEAQERSVAVQVTSVAGESVYVDKGSDALIESGDRILLHSARHGLLTGRVHSVTRSGARCTLDAGVVAVAVGTGGQILIPANRGGPKPGPAPKPPPDHPPWSAPPESWNEDRPLLVPANASPPEERPTEVFGFAYEQFSYSNNRFGQANSYLLQRLGASVTVTNPVPWGGALWFRGEHEVRDFSLASGDDVSEARARLHQLSYVGGGLRDLPYRVEVGRFLQHDFPELGTIDGAEGATRVGAVRFGASAGFIPNGEHEVTLGSTAQAAVFARVFGGARDEFAVGLAAQKTWQDSKPDRDLLVGTLEYAPSTRIFLRGAAWVDFYTTDELVKSAGAELTEAHVDATWRFDADHGIGLFFARVTQPDQRRDELDPVLAQEILENAVTRAGLYTWQGLSPTVFVEGRVGEWIDQEGETGRSGDVRLALRNALFSNGEAWISAFVTDGITTSGPGVRIGASQSTGVPLSIMYEVAQNTVEPLDESLLQHAVLFHVYAPLSRRTILTAFLDRRFGDGQDSWAGTLAVNVGF